MTNLAKADSKGRRLRKNEENVLSGEPVTKKKSRQPMQLSVALTGDQRLTQNVILEVRAIAKRYGLETPDIQVVRQPRVGPKVKLTSARKSK